MIDLIGEAVAQGRVKEQSFDVVGVLGRGRGALKGMGSFAMAMLLSDVAIGLTRRADRAGLECTSVDPRPDGDSLIKSMHSLDRPKRRFV